MNHALIPTLILSTVTSLMASYHGLGNWPEGKSPQEIGTKNLM